jgi:hypothetical protein
MVACNARSRRVSTGRIPRQARTVKGPDIFQPPSNPLTVKGVAVGKLSAQPIDFKAIAASSRDRHAVSSALKTNGF